MTHNPNKQHDVIYWLYDGPEEEAGPGKIDFRRLEGSGMKKES